MYMSWKNSLNPFEKIGENVDMTYMYCYFIKTPLKPSGKNIRRKRYGISLIANLYEKNLERKTHSKFEWLWSVDHVWTYSPQNHWENIRRNYILNIFLKTLMRK